MLQCSVEGGRTEARRLVAKGWAAAVKAASTAEAAVADTVAAPRFRPAAMVLAAAAGWAMVVAAAVVGRALLAMFGQRG